MQIAAKKIPFGRLSGGTEPWEDFLDFSRWRFPAKSVIPKRLLGNSMLYLVSAYHSDQISVLLACAALVAAFRCLILISAW